MTSIINYNKEDLEQIVSPKFRATQILDWIYKHYCFDFLQMKNLPQALREELAQKFSIVNAKILTKQVSKDGTQKYLFELKDKKTVEAVLLKMSEDVLENGKIVKESKYTICLSSQVGCKMACKFCLTGKGGFERNLSPDEIVSQVLLIKKDMNFNAVKGVNLVYMGMGEPLDNFDNLVSAINIFKFMGISPKRQTVSTSAISPKIVDLGSLDLGVQLAVSLHAADDNTRNKLIPLNKAYPIQSIINALKKFPIDTRKRLMFEYLMIKGVNDSLNDAKNLHKLLNGFKAKINLIYFNPFIGASFERPLEKNMQEFREYLLNKGVLCTIRESKGADILAACGQLKSQEQTIRS